MAAQIQRDAPVVLTKRFDSNPYYVAGCHQRIEVGRVVRLYASRQDVGFKDRGWKWRTLQLFDGVDERICALSAFDDAMPGSKKPCDCLGVNRLYFSAELCERPPPHHPEHLRIGPFASGASWPELSLEQPLFRGQANELRLGGCVTQPVPTAELGRRERATLSSIASRDIAERVPNRFEQRRGNAVGQHHTDPVPVSGGILDGDVSLLPANGDLQRAPRVHEHADAVGHIAICGSLAELEVGEI